MHQGSRISTGMKLLGLQSERRIPRRFRRHMRNPIGGRAMREAANVIAFSIHLAARTQD